MSRDWAQTSSIGLYLQQGEVGVPHQRGCLMSVLLEER